MSTLFIFRHGQASFGQENYDQLSPTGYRQARLVAEHLADIGCRFDAVYTGQLARQQQTFAAMAEVYGQNGDNLPAPVTTPDLDEYDSTGVWQHFYPGPNLSFGKTIISVDDFTGDNIPEAVIAYGNNGTTNQAVRALNGSNGQTIWTREMVDYEPKELLALPLPNDSTDIIAAEYFSRIHRLNGRTGQVEWTYPLGGLSGVIRHAFLHGGWRDRIAVPRRNDSLSRDQHADVLSPG